MEVVDASSPEALAESTGCVNISEIPWEAAPLRGLAATRGIRCDIDGEVLHVFARAPGDPDSDSPAGQQGGSLENIHRTVGAGRAGPSCSLALLVSDDVFVVGRSESVLSDLGIPGDSPIPVAPTVSYLPDCMLD